MRTSQRHVVLLIVLALVATMIGLGTAGTASAAPAAVKPGGKPSATALAAPGTVSVTITSPDSGAVNGSLELYQWEPGGEYFEWVDSAWIASPSPAGQTFDVAPGDYYVSFQDDESRFQIGYPEGATEPPATPEDVGAFAVAPGGGADAAIALVAQPAAQPVSGSVRNAAGDTVPDAFVTVYQGSDDTGDLVTDFYVESDGTYAVDLLPGTYLLLVQDLSGEYENARANVTVGDQPVTMAPIVLALSGRHAVSGTISDAAGPLGGATVRLYELYGSPGSWDDAEWIDEVTTDQNGHYSFPAVRGGSRHYTLRAEAPGHSSRFLGGFVDPLETVGFTLSADLTGANIQLPAATTLTGTVTGPGGPASGVQVTLHQWFTNGAGGGSFEAVDEDYTDSAGTYAFSTLEPGFFTLEFDTDSATEPLQGAWLAGGSAPSATNAPGVFEVTTNPRALVKDKTLAQLHVATGTVTDQSSNPVAGASVVAYRWEAGAQSWVQFATDLTGVDGAFAVQVPPSSTITFRFARGGFSPVFYGGGRALPAVPSPATSVTTPAAGDVAVGAIELPPFVSQLGKVAGQDLAYCRDHALEANDDSSSDAVAIPFELKYFGTPYTTLYVNNNGNVTFNSRQAQYTPSSLTGATNQPIIAPFFADVDTRGAGSNVVTYGASPDGKTFCVNWADVGYFAEQDDKLNTFQLLLTQNTTGAGRTAGDFDITINYDEVLWETGSASGGVDGYGGTSAAAGFSAGTGVTGTYVQLPGSFVNGALLDGRGSSLVAGSQNSGRPGRYVYQVRNDGLVSSLGGLAGTVVADATGAPVADAYVQACGSEGTGCSYTYTDSAGRYSFTALPVGAHAIRVWPPSDALFGGGSTATVVSGVSTTAPQIRLTTPLPPPAGTTITSNGAGSNGVPSVFYGEDLDLVVTGCAGIPSPTYTVTLADGTVLRDHLPMAQGAPGTYSATIQQFYPDHGEARISTNIPLTCGGSPVVFNIYIDPSGVVTDQWGRPIEGASATLLRSDTSNGSFTTVPDGSDIMSPANRANPTLTDATGYFQWDVQVGWYKVAVTATGCDPGTTAALEVPPERIDLLVPLQCTFAAPAPTAGPSLTGQLRVGQSVTPVAAQWAAPLMGPASGTKLLRNGTPVTLTSGHYTLVASDVGASFSVSSTGVRPDYVQEVGAGSTVTFTPVTVTSTPQTAATAAAPTATTKPSITGTRKVGQPLTASPGTWTATGLTYTYQWSRSGTPISGATAATYKPTSLDATKALTVTVKATRAGYAGGTATSAPVTIAKLTSSVTAKLKPAAIRTGRTATLAGVVVVVGMAAPTGTLKVLDGRKKLATLSLRPGSKGRYQLVLKKLKAGKHKLTVVYAGAGTVSGSTSKAVTLTVSKPRKR